MKLIDIIVPCYNEEETVKIFYNEITKTFNTISDEYNYNIIFINDGSIDNTLENIKNLNKTDNKVKYISFSRNFGKESALYAGLSHSKGDYVVIMDVDLQDPPSLLPEMINIIENSDYDIVATRRTSREGEPPIRSFFAKMFYKIINKVSKLELVDGARDYRIMTRQSVNALLELQEYNRFSKGLFNWIGFNTKWLSYKNIERTAGQTSWSFWGLFKYSIEGIVAFTTVPLTISTLLGIIFSIIAFLLIIILLIRHIIFSDSVAGWTSTICVILLLGGIQLLSIGILGKYLEKTYTEIKNRPIYIEQESNL